MPEGTAYIKINDWASTATPAKDLQQDSSEIAILLHREKCAILLYHISRLIPTDH